MPTAADETPTSVAGRIEVRGQPGGDGPTLVLLHGLLMDASLWDDVIADLSVDHRCVAPTLPLGSHRHAMHAGADVSLRGIARLVDELLERLDLRLAGLLPQGWLVEVSDSYTHPLDLPTRLARIVRDFTRPQRPVRVVSNAPTTAGGCVQEVPGADATSGPRQRAGVSG